MRKFMSQRKALPSFAALRIDADNRPGAVSQKPRLASIKLSIAHKRTLIERERVKIDLCGLDNAVTPKKSFGRA